MVFGNGVKNIQAAAYNGARTVVKIQLEILSNFVAFSKCLNFTLHFKYRTRAIL